jgi:2'-5' RNA ligase
MTEGASARAFFAVAPDAGWVESARAFLARVRPDLPEASWTRPESWHLTLKFFGEASRNWLAEFGRAIAGAAVAIAPLRLSTAGAAVFPPRGPARVLAVGFTADRESAALSELARAADRAARDLGLPPERRPFHPHVTFARLRRPWPADAVDRYRHEADGWAFPDWPVRSCVLYESRLRTEGAVHTPVGQWALSAREGTPA